MKREEVYGLIDEERKYQQVKWGGDQRDRTVHPMWWLVYLMKFLGKLSTAAVNGNGAEYKRQLVKVAALCVAALEADASLILEDQVNHA